MNRSRLSSRGGYVFPVRSVYASGGAFRMEQPKIWELERCVMDALRPWAS